MEHVVDGAAMLGREGVMGWTGKPGRGTRLTLGRNVNTWGVK